MSINIPELPKCPKCKKGRLVPLSSSIYLTAGSYVVVPFAKWKCTNCGNEIKGDD